MLTENQNNVLEKSDLQSHFARFKKNIIGEGQTFFGPYGEKKILYADWIASGRLYGPIEEKMQHQVGQFVANTHTETSFTGKVMTMAYHDAKQIIKRHVNASDSDVLIPTGTGMTGAVLKLQRMMGLKVPEQVRGKISLSEKDRPVVFISHMEHHSNQTSWLETLAEVAHINADIQGLVDVTHLEELLEKYADRPVKIASITSCSNVTGISTPYYEVAQMMHKHGGLCFVDFACSGPYVNMDMHPLQADADLDAIFFSPHKFLGGPGTPGILIFNRKLYKNKIPDQPGGGTVAWTNPWGGHTYFEDIETREDGGTPGFLQTIKAAMAVRLKEEMNPVKMQAREEELVTVAFSKLGKISNLKILANNIENRLGAISFYIDDLHYNLCVKLLNDLYGIQTRGGCSCAGTYGHYLLHVDPNYSKQITDLIDSGDLSKKPGWVRVSLHPTMTDEELLFICDAIEEIATNFKHFGEDYEYHPKQNDYFHKTFNGLEQKIVNDWFH